MLFIHLFSQSSHTGVKDFISKNKVNNCCKTMIELERPKHTLHYPKTTLTLLSQKQLFSDMSK